jgi:hypothetical protein
MFKFQGCGMELNELEIFDGGSGLPGQCNTFTASLCWVGGVGVEVALHLRWLTPRHGQGIQ